jgi:large subunit ribosomal protein L10
MPTEKNVKIVAELAEEFKASPLVIAAEYRGLSVTALQGVRNAIRPTGSQFQVVKNTLARIAADNAGKPELKEIIDGPIGFMTSSGDPAAAAKVFVKHIGDNSVQMTIVGGVLDGQVLTPARVDALAQLPSKEVLLAKLLGSLNSPITGLVTVMNGPVRALAIALQRIVEKKQAEATAAPAAPAAAEPAAAPAQPAQA